MAQTAPAPVPVVHPEIVTLAQRYWVRNRLVPLDPWTINAETNLYRIDGRSRLRAIRDAVTAGLLDANGVPTDACVAHVPDVEPIDLLDEQARNLILGRYRYRERYTLPLDSEYTPLAIFVWFARHPEGVAFYDRWGSVTHPALDRAITRQERALRVQQAIERGLPWILETHGHVLPEDRDIFTCQAGGRLGHSGVSFGMVPEKWGDEAETSATRLRERIRADRQKLAAVEHVQASVAKAGGWSRLAEQARAEIPLAVDAEIAEERAAETSTSTSTKETT